MSDRIRVAIVGLGAVARAVHLPIMARRTDLFDIAGVCDLSSDALAAVGDRFAVPPDRRFPDLEQMLDSVRADALAVLTSGSHTSVVLSAIERGLAVLCEKPLAATQREADALAAAVGARDDRLMLGYMKLYDPAVRRAAELVDAGRTRAVDVTVLHPSGSSQLSTSELGPDVFPLPPDLAEQAHAEQHKLSVEALGDAAATLGALYFQMLLGSVVHDLAVLRGLGIRISAIDHADRWPADMTPGSLSFSGRTGDGVRIALRWHYLDAYPAYREQVNCHQEEGSVELEFPSPYLLRAPTVLRHVTRDGDGAATWRFESFIEAFEEQLLAFHRMVTTGAAPAAGVAEGRADIVTCQRIAAQIAHREGLAVGGEAAS